MTITEVETSVSPSELKELRAQNDLLRRQLAERTAPADSPWWRNRWLSVASAVVAGILLPLAVATVWARTTMLDTDTYVRTVAPLAEHEDVQEAVSFRVTETVSEAADFRSIAEDALPPDAVVLAGPIEAGAETVMSELVRSAISTQAFARLWEDANREAHAALVPLLKGESTDLVDAAEGRVVVRLGSVAEEVVLGLDEQLGTDLAAQIPQEQLEAELVLFESRELADAQRAVRWVDRLSWFSVIFAIAFLVGTVAFAEHRRLGVRRLGLAVFIPMLVTLVVYAWTRNQYTASLPASVHNPDAAVATFDILTGYLQRSLRAVMVAGLLVLLGVWVVGPSETAARVRDSWGTLVGRAGDAGQGRDVGPVVTWVGANERSIMYALAFVAGLVAVLWNHPTGLVILLIVVCMLAAMAAVRLIAELARRSGSQPAPDSVTTTHSSA